MELLGIVLIFTQLIFTIIAGTYFYVSLKNQQGGRVSATPESRKEAEKLHRLRQIHLTEPLSERTRPTDLNEIKGQSEGINALKAALFGKNPQHILIYGPPGVGKTAAARIVLEEAKKSKNSPFKTDSKFVEMDATILQFDERSIADPLLGSVHDPIYQGAGAYGAAGIPQPKPGAVTRAHGGVLFIDEIGELHPLQMNKLLKVLEDRKVFLSSSYYNSEDKAIPSHIHDIFENGLPADFRLIGATTRQPEELPPALRSRCTEIYFKTLNDADVQSIAENAFVKAGFKYDAECPAIITKYSGNGRDTVNIVQSAASIAECMDRKHITVQDVENAVEYGRYSPKINKKISAVDKTGVINGLAVCGAANGILLEIEAEVSSAVQGNGSLKITGIAEEESIKSAGGSLKRQSTARASVENVITVLENKYGIKASDYNIHINFPGGMPVDGPSAGIAIFCAVYSALYNIAPDREIAMTGELSIKGKVLPVGGVRDKIDGAKAAGAKKVIIPYENMQKNFETTGIEIIPVITVEAVISAVFGHRCEQPGKEKTCVNVAV